MITEKEIEAFIEMSEAEIKDKSEMYQKVVRNSRWMEMIEFTRGAKWMQEKMKEKNEKSDYEHDLQFNSCI